MAGAGFKDVRQRLEKEQGAIRNVTNREWKLRESEGPDKTEDSHRQGVGVIDAVTISQLSPSSMNMSQGISASI
jgi:hypothetical protein